MTPEQALENLNQAASAIQLDRQRHIVLMQSVELLKKVIASLPKKDEAGE